MDFRCAAAFPVDFCVAGEGFFRALGTLFAAVVFAVLFDAPLFDCVLFTPVPVAALALAVPLDDVPDEPDAVRLRVAGAALATRSPG